MLAPVSAQLLYLLSCGSVWFGWCWSLYMGRESTVVTGSVLDTVTAADRETVIETVNAEIHESISCRQS